MPVDKSGGWILNGAIHCGPKVRLCLFQERMSTSPVYVAFQIDRGRVVGSHKWLPYNFDVAEDRYGVRLSIDLRGAQEGRRRFRVDKPGIGRSWCRGYLRRDSRKWSFGLGHSALTLSWDCAVCATRVLIHDTSDSNHPIERSPPPRRARIHPHRPNSP